MMLKKSISDSLKNIRVKKSYNLQILLTTNKNTMKKILILCFVTMFSFLLFACGKEKKPTENTEANDVYVIDAANSSVQWTAYKTTDKLPVKGTFKEINITASNDGKSSVEAIEGLEFEIPVSSIFTKDTIRDHKINKFFFAVMDNTLSLKGVFSVENETQGNLALTMNGMTQDLPFTYETSKDTIMIGTKMDLNVWGAQTAVESLNQVCLELHKGPDGVSKTWDEVAISAKILTKKN